MKVKPAKMLSGTVRLPGDKSISHRAAMFAAIADGETKIENFASSADCASTLECLRGLGVGIERDGASVTVKGVGKTGLREPAGPLDCGNSGTTMRLMAGILAGQSINSTMVGDESLQSRPMKRVIEPLSKMGAEIESVEGRAPLRIRGVQPLRAVDHDLRVASAQIKSCILLAGLNADGTTSVLEPVPTRDHTERMLRWLGADVREETTENGKKISISGDTRLTAKGISVPSDVSSAAFFMVAAACLTDSDLKIIDVGLNPSRTAIIDVLQRLGAFIEVSNEREVCNEPVGDIRIRGGAPAADAPDNNLVSGKVIANLIDEIPILAVYGTQIGGGLEVRDASELRVKETDRISAVVENLKRMGAKVEEFPDGFRVERSKLKGAVVDSFGDHRIAMAFAVAALFAEGETEIVGSESAAVSFPEFFETLGQVVNY
jgi:3-phosphoshikimate 1-carboxyvinyltransferase